MAEYVDRKQLMKERERAIQVYENANIFSVEAIRSGLKPLLDKIVDLHTADVEEVTYCKDCKWATKRIKENGFFTHQCCNTIAFGMSPRRATDFCSYGERK